MRKFAKPSSDESGFEQAHNQRFGAGGEDAAAEWYAARGYQLVARNWRCREGEIDLILRSPTDLVFCEVKRRSSLAFGSPVEAVTASKRARIRKLAVLYLGSHASPGNCNLRFDVAAVLGNEVTVFENAF